MSLYRICSVVPEILYDAPEEIDSRSTLNLFRDAVAIAFLQTFRIGCIVTVRGCKGCVLKKLPDNSWSAPCALMFGGPALGASIGMELADIIVFIKNEKALNAFMKSNAGIGLSGGLALGPFGRSGEAMLTTGSSEGFLVYAQTKGLYGGVNLEISGILVDHTANKVQYGPVIKAEEIVSGQVPKPKGEVFDRMYKALDELTAGSMSTSKGVPQR